MGNFLGVGQFYNVVQMCPQLTPVAIIAMVTKTWVFEHKIVYNSGCLDQVQILIQKLESSARFGEF